MSPNLVLLVDRTSDSSLGQIGPILTSKLQDNEWEIRESCLGVLMTISELSHSMYLLFVIQNRQKPVESVWQPDVHWFSYETRHNYSLRQNLRNRQVNLHVVID